MNVLVVEDDVALASLLERVFAEEGHNVSVSTSLAKADAALANSPFDLVVLDWMLPDGDGLALCARLQGRKPPLAVVMLTARGEVQDRVTGLRVGADDYIKKPFEIEELLARVEAVCRRVNQGWVSRFGSLEIDRRTQLVHADGRRLSLTAREYALLVRLADAPDECVTRAQLLADVWNVSFDPGSGVLDVHLSRLREKLEGCSWMIETVRGQGLKLRTAR
ncbi:MAG TPA: response regulator transcription factor [Polyangiaceae bacterium]|nr:response regulator transcription factor [Polyangiaceae bacterium]